jgi:hypothetical protein
MCIVSCGYLSLTFLLMLIPWWIICHFSSSLKSPTPGFVLQAGLLDNPEKSFSLPVYAEAMARASLRSGPTCAPRPGHGVDPRVINYLDIDATIDTSFPSDCLLDSKCNPRSGEIFECCSDDSMSS